MGAEELGERGLMVGMQRKTTDSMKLWNARHLDFSTLHVGDPVSFDGKSLMNGLRRRPHGTHYVHYCIRHHC